MPLTLVRRRAPSCVPVLAVAVAAAIAACSESPPPPPPPARRAAAPAPTARDVRDSTWVDVGGPTLIAFYAPSIAAALDSGGDAATALDDFGYNLASARDSLRVLGVRVANVESTLLHVVADGRTTVFRVPRDSAPLGFYLVAPGRPPSVRYGAQADAELIAWAEEYLKR